jgi:threonine dehydratase
MNVAPHTLPKIDPTGIAAVERLIRPYIRRTPVIETRGADFGLHDSTLFFKLELCQHAGSFKTRGAFANLLGRTIPPSGVVAASGGNHGVAVAYAARVLGVPAKIFVPTVASSSKIEKIRNFGATLAITGDRYADALAASEQWAEQSGVLQVHAFDQIETLLGQGTLGLEFEQQVAELDTVLVPVGGGGLIGGIAAWFAQRIDRGEIKIIGVEPETAPTLTLALRAGHPVDAPAGGIAADSLAPRRVGEIMFPLAQNYVSSVILVSDDSIQEAQQSLWSNLRVTAEPGGAAAFAALLSGRYSPKADERVGIIVSGGNTSAVDFSAARALRVERRNGRTDCVEKE